MLDRFYKSLLNCAGNAVNGYQIPKQNSPSMMTDNKPHNLLTDALVLAIVPALGYALTVLHEVGYMTYFNLPLSLIRIETPMALITSAYVLGFFLLFLFLFDSFTEPIESFVNNTTSNWFLPAALYLVYASIPYITRAKLMEDGDYVDLQVACYMFLGLYFSLFCHSFKTSVANRIEESNAKDEQIKYWSRTLFRRLPRPLLALIGIALLAIYFSFNLGVSEARHQKWFLIPESAPDAVVFRIYGDNLVTSKFDRVNQEMIPRFTIQPLGDASPKEAAVLKYEPIGPLKPWGKN
jgi:hypothetical protein